MRLKDIHLGNIDAKNELLNDSEVEKARFVEAFVVPPNLVIEKYLKKEKYYVLGLKGTGKTALLRLLSIKLEEMHNTKSLFVLFKSEIDEDLRKDLTRASRTSIAEKNIEEFEGEDFESVWRWFTYKKLIEFCEENRIGLFLRNEQYERFSQLIKSPIEGEEKSGLSKLIPKIKKGNIEISKSPKIAIELDWSDDGKAKIRFNDLVRRADELFDGLKPGTDSLNIFFDELELNYATAKQYKRDSQLIRDLIVSVEKLNAKSKNNCLNLCIYCAVRTEVQGSVSSLGKEINKPLVDFGTEILWNRKGVDVSSQPLLFVLTERLKVHMKHIAGKEYSHGEIWGNFFPTQVQNRSTQEYILHHSWYRPRDIVRLLKIAQDQYPNEAKFTHSVFDAIKKTYSSASWIEMTEELKSKYKGNEVNAIKRLLYGFKQVFTFGEMKARIESIQELYPEVKDLTQNKKIQNILSDLYRIGVVGNIHEGNMRFSFRGDDEILLEQSCYVHNALKAHLSITKYS